MQNVDAARSLALSDDEFPMLDAKTIGNLPMPILLMSGANTAPVHAAIFSAVSAAMPRAHVRIVKDSGHSVSQQQPEAFNWEVFGFLEENNFLAKQPAWRMRLPSIAPSKQRAESIFNQLASRIGFRNSMTSGTTDSKPSPPSTTAGNKPKGNLCPLRGERVSQLFTLDW